MTVDRLRARIARVLRERRGNVLMMFGFMLVPLTFATGMGIDYARAMKSQTKLNAVADAAALLAVSKTMMPLSDSQAADYATQMFRIQAAASLGDSRFTITSVTASAPTDANGKRTASVSYTATSPNTFAGVLGLGWLNIHGTSQTINATAPNIDFYMLLDVSGSMALPTTSAGLSKIAASNSRGCQFACHSSNDLKGIDAFGHSTDLYSVAKSFGLTLRIDDEGTAVAKLTADATSTSSRNGATYRMGISTFRGRGGFLTPQTITADLHSAAHQVDHLAPSFYYSNGCPTQKCASTDIGYGDQDSGASDAFDHMNAVIPTPGKGINKDKPQAIMFIITDGMRDEARSGGNPEAAFDTTKCDALKARGIRIGILYTEYLRQSLDNDSWSQAHVAPILYKVEPALQACASPGLYTKISTDEDIYTALDTLFQSAVATARISG